MFTFLSSCLRKSANIDKASFYAHVFFEVSLDFSNFQYSKNIYQELTMTIITIHFLFAVISRRNFSQGTFSPKTLQNINNVEGQGLILNAYVKSVFSL